MNKAAMNILVLCTLKDTHTHTHETIAMNKIIKQHKGIGRGSQGCC